MVLGQRCWCLLSSRATALKAAMSFPDPEAEEQTLHTFFGEHIPGGETSKLRPACTFVQQFIAQELWWVTCEMVDVL